MNHFVFLSFYFGAKNGSPALCMATRSQFVEYRQVGYQLCYFPHQNKPGILKLTTSNVKAKGTCVLFLFLLPAKKKAVIVSFRQDTKILTADRTTGSAVVCRAISLLITIQVSQTLHTDNLYQTYFSLLLFLSNNIVKPILVTLCT